jgi:hypothetical protein
MFVLADYGIVATMEQTKHSGRFLKKDIAKAKNDLIQLSEIAEHCKDLQNRNNKLMRDNVDMYCQYKTSMMSLGFLNQTIRTYLMKKSQNDFEQWSVVLESETRKANEKEEDRVNALRDSIVS